MSNDNTAKPTAVEGWPTWANFRALDSDGTWWFYENEPSCEGGVWDAPGRLERDWMALRVEPILERRHDA